MRADLIAETAEQRARVTETAAELDTALMQLATEAKAAARRLGGKRPNTDLSPVVGAFRRVERAEQAFDIARHDLATAGGEDA